MVLSQRRMPVKLALNYSQKAKAASAYRSLLRSSKFTFKSDPKTYDQFVNHAKELFLTKVLNTDYLIRTPPTPNEASSLNSQAVKLDRQFENEIQGVLEVSSYLTRNIIQGKHSEDGKRLVLRFTPKIEIGDNLTIKSPTPINLLPSSNCCGSSNSPASTSKLSQAALDRLEKRRLNRLQQTLPPSNPSAWEEDLCVGLIFRVPGILLKSLSLRWWDSKRLWNQYSRRSIHLLPMPRYLLTLLRPSRWHIR